MKSSHQKFSQKVGNAFKKVFTPTRKYNTRQEEIEQGAAKAHDGLAKCKVCGIYHFKKTWHNERPEGAVGLTSQEVICPADEMQMNGEYEGKVTLFNVPEQHQMEIKHLAENMGKYSKSEHPLHRVLSIEEKDGNLEIYTSENQLAQKIGNKIDDSFKQAFRKSEVMRGQNTNTIDVELYWVKTV